MEVRTTEDGLKPSVLIYHIYLVNNWKSLSEKLLSNVPHDDVYVNISVDWYRVPHLFKALLFFKKFPKVKAVFVTRNKKELAEVVGFEKLRRNIDWGSYQLLTYMHGKGVTKPKNDNIIDWVELMRYYVIDKMDLCRKAFIKGYQLYGINLALPKPGELDYGPYKFSDFHFSGNFVNVNLSTLKEKFLATPIDKDYFGVEGFWGKLCSIDHVFCAYESGIENHYKQPYPEYIYKDHGCNQNINQE